MTFDQREYMLSRLTPRFGRGEAMAMVQWMEEEPDGSYDPDDVIARLLRDEPLQYIFGHTDWRGLRLSLSADTLIPRPETSDVVDAAIELYRSSGSTGAVLDIGTGSGCIAIALKKALPDAPVFACDISEGALLTASRNAAANGADVRFFRQDILAEEVRNNIEHQLTSPYEGGEAVLSLVISNPPYICESEKASMEQNVLAYEPSRALFVPDADPLLFYRTIARLHLAPLLCFEINERFGSQTAEMLCEEGYSSVRVLNDLYGKERIVVALDQS